MKLCKECFVPHLGFLCIFCEGRFCFQADCVFYRLRFAGNVFYVRAVLPFGAVFYGRGRLKAQIRLSDGLFFIRSVPKLMQGVPPWGDARVSRRVTHPRVSQETETACVACATHPT
ncbi:hypothetical protein HMPREF9123_1448 [Neisseria bacilliformis ATCC BAA-1200]|uniref:Uncharacterized protein n=1 Tax=Neisseria bacilliformis ATCC BAA-1200 TaxID=888742 RepID=F2BCJ3_9NEIS|nr:hypothetical protein HMPREF9123_1448 [Neisseria bacilliformis ATCC BAA-1200]